MINYKELFLIEPFSMKQKFKDNWFFKIQKKLSKHHYQNCPEYKKISNNIFDGIDGKKKIEEFPFLHTDIFKNFNLKSVSVNEPQNTFTSSGTSGSKVSKINIDRKTALLQSKTLKRIFSQFIKEKPDHIFFIDKPSVLKGALSFSARGAAIKGFSQVTNKFSFLLDDNNKLRAKILLDFLEKNPDKKFIIFGFTSFVWKFFLQVLIEQKIKLRKNNGILIHGGGWKKMQDQSITRNLLYKKINTFLGIKKIHNYYGMVEQTGAIFLECERGFFHTSIFSEIIIRDKNLDVSALKKKGLIQVLSILPLSYPGHNILTEDIGILEGIDNCLCGRSGKYFTIIGRVPGTELRGCSDAY